MNRPPEKGKDIFVLDANLAMVVPGLCCQTRLGGRPEALPYRYHSFHRLALKEIKNSRHCDLSSNPAPRVAEDLGDVVAVVAIAVVVGVALIVRGSVAPIVFVGLEGRKKKTWSARGGRV